MNYLFRTLTHNQYSAFKCMHFNNYHKIDLKLVEPISSNHDMNEAPIVGLTGWRLIKV